MGDRVVSLRALQFMYGLLHFLLTLPPRGFHLVQFLLEFRNFQHGQRLPFPHSVPHIDIDMFHVAGDLGVDLNFLKWPEFRCDAQSLGKVGTHYLGDGDVHSFVRVGTRRGAGLLA